MIQENKASFKFSLKSHPGKGKNKPKKKERKKEEETK